MPTNKTKILDLGGLSVRVNTIDTGYSKPSGSNSTGGVSLSASTGLGYTTGVGGTVTQATNRTTGVTLSKLSGQITTNNASLAVETGAAFTVTNTLVAATDVIVVSIASGSNSGNTTVSVSAVAAGSFNILVSNNNAAAGTAETGAIVINFVVIKGVSS